MKATLHLEDEDDGSWLQTNGNVRSRCGFWFPKEQVGLAKPGDPDCCRRCERAALPPTVTEAPPRPPSGPCKAKLERDGSLVTVCMKPLAHAGKHENANRERTVVYEW